MNSRIINITVKGLSLPNLPEEVSMPNFIYASIRRLMLKSECSQSMDLLRNIIEHTITSENILLNATSGEIIHRKNVYLVVDVNECDHQTIMSLNIHYHMFDINHMKPLSYLSEIQKYGETLAFTTYEFFILAVKSMCTVNTRIGRLNSCPGFMSHTDYNGQDFLVLIKEITEAKAFTLEVEGIPYQVTCTHCGWVKVDGEAVNLLSELSENVNQVIISMYNKKPRQFH